MKIEHRYRWKYAKTSKITKLQQKKKTDEQHLFWNCGNKETSMVKFVLFGKKVTFEKKGESILTKRKCSRENWGGPDV